MIFINDWEASSKRENIIVSDTGKLFSYKSYKRRSADKKVIHTFSKGRAVRIVETGKIYSSESECARCINGIQSDISQCLTGKRRTHRGYHFEYVEEVRGL